MISDAVKAAVAGVGLIGEQHAEAYATWACSGLVMIEATERSVAEHTPIEIVSLLGANG